MIVTPAESRQQLQSNQLLLHLQRHGQGFHNLMAEHVRSPMGDLAEEGNERPALHPYKLPEMVDPPLTDKGRHQCKARQSLAASMTPQIIITSPLCRAMQTALITFHSHVSEHPLAFACRVHHHFFVSYCVRLVAT